ncbi:MAG: hypothetical protein JXR95_16805 [Deltaproteobacteria bacterium]|nr:hypothetical protein [Deltaproteobacteria bacterium]
MMKKTLLFLTLVLIMPSTAFSSEETWVAGSPFNWEVKKSQPLGFSINLGFRYESESSAISREEVYSGSDSHVVKDLAFSRNTSILDLGGEFGFKGFSFFLNLPITISSQSIFKFQDGSTYTGYADFESCLDRHPTEEYLCNPSGVNSTNSTTVLSGISDGLFTPDSPLAGDAGVRTLFKGKNRSGLDQLHLGFKFNVPIFNQEEDHTKPFWVLVVDLGLPVGEVMDFERNSAGDPLCSNGSACVNPEIQRPVLNGAVGKGVYDVTLSSVMSKSIGRFDTYFKLYATLPFAYDSDSFYGSKYNFSDNWGMKDMKAPIKGGILFGGDVNVYKNSENKIAVNIFAKGAIKGVFEGQDYSEAYELFAGSPALNFYDGHETLNILTSDQTLTNRIQYFPGITTVENYAIFEALLGVNVRVTEYAIFQLAYGLKHHTEHFITYADRGVDGKDPTATTPGEIDTGTREINPYYRENIDSTGKRYRVQETMVHSLLLSFRVFY